MYKRITYLVIVSLLLFYPALSQPKKADNSQEVQLMKSEIFNGLKIRNIGPARNSGRISDFAVNPENQAEYYVAVASGGVWKTTNSGTTWTPVFDSQGSYSIGCVSLDPDNSQVVWVGTGENNNQRSVAYGDGIYKSTDGGQSWNHMGLKNSEHISKIIVDPENSDVIYVAAVGPLWSAGGDRGVFKSTDGGKTWDNVLFISPHTGVADMVMDPRNSKVLYAAAHQRRRHVFTYISGGPESALYKSTDGGATWSKLENGMPKNDIGRIGLAIAPSNPDIVYAIVEAEGKDGGFYRSTDRGASWKKMNDYYTSGNYYSEIVCDPQNENLVYSMDTWMHYTEDGGKTFQRINERGKHVDNHAMWIDPDNTSYLLVGCDGGVYESFDGGDSWNYKRNLPVTQFYKVATDNAEPFYNVYGGTQDNFSMYGPAQTTSVTGIPNSEWIMTNGGDGFESQADPTDHHIVYAQAQYGWLVRYDKRTGQRVSIKPIEGPDEEAYRWNWDSPLLISPHQHTRLYFAANKLFRSDDRGNNWEVISPDLSRQIDRNKIKVMGKVWSMDAVAKNNSTTIYGNIVALAESPLQEDLLYVGTDDGLIQVSEDGGQNWRKTDKFPGVPDTTYVNFLMASQHDVNTVYAAFNNHKRGDFKPYILKSTDKGGSWQSVASDLPERGSVYSLAEDHVQPGLLFAGTEFGLFFSRNDGKNWIQLKNGLPTIAIRDLEVQKRENDLVLASFGRGFYVLDDYSPLREVSSTSLAQEARLFPVKTVKKYIQSEPLGMNVNSFLGDAYYTAENPPYGAIFTYYLKEDIKTLKQQRQELEKQTEEAGGTIKYPQPDEIRSEDQEPDPYLLFVVKDAEGNTVRKIKTTAKKGIQRINWDLRYPASDPIELKSNQGYNPWDDQPLGPLVTDGKYQVTMGKFVNGEYTQLAGPVQFEVKSLNRSTLENVAPVATLEFQQKVSGLKRAVDGVVKTLSEYENQLQFMDEAIRNTPDLAQDMLKEINDLQKRIDNLQIDLSGDASLARRNFPTKPSISSRVGLIVYGLWNTTAEPTGTMRDSYQAAANQFEPLLNRVNQVKDEIGSLQDRLEQAEAPFTPGRLPKWQK
ncbi:MAG: WD40/YVTN/BNR-like repeat-containing protein [Candidatus Cyclobacteriaceae bacterium M3_2C_046]